MKSLLAHRYCTNIWIRMFSGAFSNGYQVRIGDHNLLTLGKHISLSSFGGGGGGGYNRKNLAEFWGIWVYIE